MSTNNPGITGLSAPESQGDVGGSPIAAATPAAQGLPDAAVVAQLANALFAALPGRPTVQGLAADAQAAPPSSALPVAPPLAPEGEFASLLVAPYVSPTSGFSPPSDAELRSAPASLASVGGLASPATAATPPAESSFYFLDPAQPGLTGPAVGLGPSSATRLEAGAMPTAPSPPSAFAQPAEPDLRSSPATASAATVFAPSLPSGVPAEGPYAFRPELVPAPTGGTPPTGGASAHPPIPIRCSGPGGTPPTGGASAPTAVPPATLPQGAGSLPPPAATPPLAAAAPSVESDPRGFTGGPGLPLQAAGQPGSSFYFLGEANPFLEEAKAAPDFDPFGFPAVVSEPEFGEYPFDSRANASPRPPVADPTAGITGR